MVVRGCCFVWPRPSRGTHPWVASLWPCRVSDTLANNLVLLAVTAATSWWQVGGRNRRVLADMSLRLEVLEILPKKRSRELRAR